MKEARSLIGVLIKVKVDADAHTAEVEPEEVHGGEGTKFTWAIEPQPGTNDADVKAFLSVPDHDVLDPDVPTSEIELQGCVYPFQGTTMNRRKLSFVAVQGDAMETAIITVHFPQSEQQSLPVSSVVIIDM